MTKFWTDKGIDGFRLDPFPARSRIGLNLSRATLLSSNYKEAPVFDKAKSAITIRPYQGIGFFYHFMRITISGKLSLKDQRIPGFNLSRIGIAVIDLSRTINKRKQMHKKVEKILST
jgi:hypothetical protein